MAVLCRGLEKNGMVRAWHGCGMASVNQTRPHCVNQMGKTHSKPLAARHGRRMACYVWIGLNLLTHVFISIYPFTGASQGCGDSHNNIQSALFHISLYLCCSMYCLCVNVYCHRVTTQLQLINISYNNIIVYKIYTVNYQYIMLQVVTIQIIPYSLKLKNSSIE